MSLLRKEIDTHSSRQNAPAIQNGIFSKWCCILLCSSKEIFENYKQAQSKAQKILKQ